MGFLKPTPNDLDDDLRFFFTLAAFSGDPLFKGDPLFRTNLAGAVEYVRARRNVVLCRSEFCPNNDDYWCGGGKALASRPALRRLRSLCVNREGGRFYKPPSPLTLFLDDRRDSS